MQLQINIPYLVSKPSNAASNFAEFHSDTGAETVKSAFSLTLKT